MARTDLSYSPSDSSQFERLGHPGRYTSVLKYTGNGQLDLTGSNYGYGAMMIGSGSGVNFGDADYISLSGGGDILLTDLKKEHSAVGVNVSPILDLSVSQISSSIAAPDIYFFKRQQ